MSESNFEQPANPAEFGPWLARKTLAEQQAKLAALSADHRPDHDRVTTASNQHGIFGAGATGYDQAAEVAERAHTVGSGLPGCGRPLLRLGGTDWESQGAGAVGPTPGRVYASQLGRQVPGDMMSPLKRYQLGQQ